MNTPNIQAYFSHSYRKEDRDVNLFFWKLFHENGFFFAIDPKSSSPDDNLFNITYLERLMRSSDCFIAVVTVRKKKDGPGYTHSPYLAFENFLAELAEKPRLVFVEKGLDSSVFGSDHSDSVHIFERNKLESREDKIRDIVQEFSSTVTSYQSYSSIIQPVDSGNKAGILIHPSQGSGYSDETIRLIKSQLKSCINHRAELLQPSLDDGLQEFIRKISEYDLVLMDVCDPSITPDILAMIQAKATPCVRLAKSASSETIERLKAKGILKDYFIGSDSPLIVWEDDNDLQVRLEKYLNKFNQEQERIFYKTYESGFRYFKSAGRRPAFIFISNHTSLQPTASELSKQMEDVGIGEDSYFQYLETSIKTGKPWKEELDKNLNKCDIFVALVNEEFQKSEYCRYELQVAVERQSEGVIIQAYQCAGTSMPEIIRDIQYRDLRKMSENEIPAIIVKDLEEVLDRPAPEIGESTRTAGGFNGPTFASGIRGAAVINYTINQTITGSTIQGSVAAAGEMKDSLNTKKEGDGGQAAAE